MDEIIGIDIPETDTGYLFSNQNINTTIAYIFFDPNLNSISYTFNKDRVQGDYVEVDTTTLQIPLDVYVKKFFIIDGTLQQDDSLLLDYVKSIKLQDLHVKTTNYIFSQYPDVKQRSDINDYTKYRSLALRYLLADYETFELQIIDTAVTYFTDPTTTFDTLKSTITNPVDSTGNPIIPTEDFDIIVDQLLKYHIRQEFVSRIKTLFRSYETEILSGTDYTTIYSMTFDFTSVRDITEV